MIYIFMVAIVVLAIVFAVIARKKIATCESEQERKAVKAKWQLICGLIGAACVICAAVMIMMMF